MQVSSENFERKQLFMSFHTLFISTVTNNISTETHHVNGSMPS
jgi:hypothetical protein